MERLGSAMAESVYLGPFQTRCRSHSAGTPMLERPTRGRRTRTGGVPHRSRPRNARGRSAGHPHDGARRFRRLWIPTANRGHVCVAAGSGRPGPDPRRRDAPHGDPDGRAHTRGVWVALRARRPLCRPLIEHLGSSTARTESGKTLNALKTPAPSACSGPPSRELPCFRRSLRNWTEDTAIRGASVSSSAWRRGRRTGWRKPPSG